jgi:2-(1,2-epoxy-1,2-dihydrophenyl)acetyl-CoA isomerase
MAPVYAAGMAISYATSQGVATITLDRPDVLNAVNDEMGTQLLRAVERASADDGIRCMIVTGAGRAFSSGEDLGALSDHYRKHHAPNLGHILTDRYNPLIRSIRGAAKPVVAAVNGVAAGAGASLALACDFRIASEHASFVLAFVKVGLVPDSGALWFLARIVGAARAWDLAATGRPVGAEEALELGLVHKVVPAAQLEDVVHSLAADLASGPTRAYALTKSLINGATERPLDEQLDLEVDAQAEAGRTKDHVEGVQAFLERRPPTFTGT